MISRKVRTELVHILVSYDLHCEIKYVCVFLQLGGFVEKYAGSGVSVHTPSSSEKENRRTEGLNRYLQTLQSNQSPAAGQRFYVMTFDIKKNICGITLAA